KEVAQDGLLEQGFERAERWLRPARDPKAAGRTKYRALARSAAALAGGRLVAAPLAVSFADTVNPAGIAQPGCSGCGDCCGGRHAGAKTPVALPYLPDAARHGPSIFPHAGVRRVARSGDGRWQVHFERLEGPAGGALPAELRVNAAIVVLA